MEQQWVEEKLQPAIEDAVLSLINQVYSSGSISEDKRIEIGTKINTTTTSVTGTGIRSSISTITLFTTIAERNFQTQLGLSLIYP
jgi:hypothetical protein